MKKEEVLNLALPKLKDKDYIILNQLITKHPNEFYSDKTSFFMNEMFGYIEDGRIWRNTIMGEPRGGKSEVASTLCFEFKTHFNTCLEMGYFDDFDLIKDGLIKLDKIEYNTSFVMGSQSDYLYELRSLEKIKKLKFGQIWHIDESRDEIGGLGTYSEMIEQQNLSNIVAKFMQSEIWITPLKFQVKNCPYGLYVYQKDIKRRINFCLLYKLEMNPSGGMDKHFMGWVGIPLHTNSEFRKKYNKKKDEWIKGEIRGVGNKRVEERKKVSLDLSHDDFFSQLHPKGRTFVLNKNQQIALLENWIIQGRTQNWNEEEKYRIIEEARMLILEKNLAPKVEVEVKDE